MNIQTIKKLLSDYDQDKVGIYTGHLLKLQAAKDKKKQLKNPWMAYRKDEELAGFFKRVALDGLDFDGEHITLQSAGVSYDYIAYKNKMLLVYAETLFDVSLVYKDDTFEFEKQSGRIVYTHKLNNPFEQDEKNIIGGYCIIKNKRGEFITTLSMGNIQKHRKVAKTDLIWASWLHEMCLKTIIKKACKQHFADMYQNIETLDNENYDLEQPLGIDIKDKAAVEKLKTVPEVAQYWLDNKGRNAGMIKDFTKLCANKKASIEKAIIEAAENKAQETEKCPEDDSVRQPGEEG